LGHCGGSEDILVETCSRKEFILFLDAWREQGMGPAEPFRSALVWQQRRTGVQGFDTAALDLKIMVRGAGARGGKMDKGVLDAAQVEQVRDNLASVSVVNCKGCDARASENVRAAFDAGVTLLTTCSMRPMNLRELRVGDWQRDAEGAWLRLRHDKTSPQGRWVPLAEATATLLDDLAVHAHNGFVLPICTRTHLDRALKMLAATCGWEAGLVWSPHCLRHSFMSEVKKAEEELAARRCGVTGRTFRGYTRTMAQRVGRQKT
jgi:hypothetical protein